VIDRFEDVLDLIQRNDFDRLYDRLEPILLKKCRLRWG